MTGGATELILTIRTEILPEQQKVQSLIRILNPSRSYVLSVLSLSLSLNLVIFNSYHIGQLKQFAHLKVVCSFSVIFLFHYRVLFKCCFCFRCSINL